MKYLTEAHEKDFFTVRYHAPDLNICRRGECITHASNDQSGLKKLFKDSVSFIHNMGGDFEVAYFWKHNVIFTHMYDIEILAYLDPRMNNRISMEHAFIDDAKVFQLYRHVYSIGKIMYADIKWTGVHVDEKQFELKKAHCKKRTQSPYYTRLMSTFFDKAKITKSRIHSDYPLPGSKTGRVYSKNFNIQNLVKDPQIQSIFAPPEGKQCIYADYKNMELRVAAILSKDEALLTRIFARDEIYQYFADDINRILESNAVCRDCAKEMFFRFLYNSSAKALHTSLKEIHKKTTPADVSKISRHIYTRFSDLRHWAQGITNEGLNTGSIVTPFGRVIAIEKYTQPVNYTVQSVASDIFHSAACNIYSNPAFKGKITMTKHDALVVECSNEDAEKCEDIITYHMKSPSIMEMLDPPVTNLLEVEIKRGLV